MPDSPATAPDLPPDSAPNPAPKPTLLQLLTTFATISVYGFGGALAWVHLFLVEKRRWMSTEEFNELYSLAQFLPGPNVVNLSFVFGSRLHSWLGGIVALTGLLGPPMVIIVILGVLYAHFGELEFLRAMLGGVAAAAAGLVIATVVKMAKPLFRGPLSPAPFIAIVGFVAIGVLRWPLPWVFGVLAPVSIAVAWVRS